ncbi:MAG: nitrilase-related carbon-nitrogen hydrolase [bacterium]
MKVGFVQMNVENGKIKDNLMRAESLIKDSKADLLVLPELFNTGYLFSSKNSAMKYAEVAGEGETFDWLKSIAIKIGGFVIAGVIEKDEDRLYNSAFLVGPIGLLGHYRKAHLFGRESDIFTPGDLTIHPFNMGLAKIGMMICFDWLFPEVARVLALRDAQIIAHPSNLILPYCQDAMVTRSIENMVFTITANRVGVEKLGDVEMRFTGKSQVVSPKGEVLTRASETEEEVHIVEIDPDIAVDKHITPENDIFKDRRTDLFPKVID